MRAFILIAAAALGLAACGSNSNTANTANGADSLTAENAVSNDVTAIDAVTGEDANMAADVNFINEATWPATPRPTTKTSRLARARGPSRRRSRRKRRPIPRLNRRPPPTRSDSLGQPDDLVRLQRQAPFGPLHRQRNRRLDRASHALMSAAQSIGWTRKWSKSQPSSSAGSIPAAATPASTRRPTAGRPLSRPWG